MLGCGDANRGDAILVDDAFDVAMVWGCLPATATFHPAPPPHAAPAIPTTPTTPTPRAALLWRAPTPPCA